MAAPIADTPLSPPPGPSGAMPPGRFDPSAITRPDKLLMTYYFIVSLLLGPVFFVPLLPMWAKYYTLRYSFDAEGISMSWGILFRREIVLTYRRIQDIHVTRNIVQRWMGLATVQIQTASGNAQAEMSIEGILEADELRDYLYTRMRGARGEREEKGQEEGLADEALVLLREIRDALGAGSEA